MEGTARELSQELVDGAGAGGFDVAARAEGGHGPLLALAEEDLVDEVGADVAVVGGEVDLQGCVVGREPAEEDGDELELVDVFGGEAGGPIGRGGALDQGPGVGGAAGQLELVAVVRTVGVTDAGAVVGVVARGGEGLAADSDVSGRRAGPLGDFDKVGGVEAFAGLDGGAVRYGAGVLGERVVRIGRGYWGDGRVGASDTGVTCGGGDGG